MMTNKKDVLVATNTAGLEKAINGDYAFLMESASIEYYTLFILLYYTLFILFILYMYMYITFCIRYEIERHCEVSQVGGLLDEKGYGIAMKKGKFHQNNI